MVEKNLHGPRSLLFGSLEASVRAGVDLDENKTSGIYHHPA